MGNRTSEQTVSYAQYFKLAAKYLWRSMRGHSGSGIFRGIQGMLRLEDLAFRGRAFPWVLESSSSMGGQGSSPIVESWGFSSESVRKAALPDGSTYTLSFSGGCWGDGDSGGYDATYRLKQETNGTQVGKAEGPLVKSLYESAGRVTPKTASA